MNKIIYVINPNSSEAVTRGFDQTLETLRLSDGPKIQCLTLDDAPAGIQSQYDADLAAVLVSKRIKELDQEHGDNAAAYVIACFSDPGLFASREITSKPVLGIGEVSILTAMTMGQNIGIIAILNNAINRHQRMFGAAAISPRVTAELALGLTIQELSNAEATKAKLLETGLQLKDKHQVNVIVLGCAGMAMHRKWLEEQINLPVVDPTQAAVSMALGKVLLSWK